MGLLISDTTYFVHGDGGIHQAPRTHGPQVSILHLRAVVSSVQDLGIGFHGALAVDFTEKPGSANLMKVLRAFLFYFLSLVE